jgi:Mce-associated membrane protein
MADNADAADTAELVDESPCLAEARALDVDDVDGVAEDFEPSESAPPRPHGSRLALALGLLIVTALGGLVGWLGFRADESHQREQQRAMFLAAARQGALNLTTISYTEVDADIKRILDSATGTFHDDFEKRSQPFVEVVKQAQSKSQGTITEAGLESVQGDNARALVAVTVTTSTAGAAQQEPRSWRMRIEVQKVGDMAKVSNVEFIP